jgi:hypothetical protein
MKRPTMLTDILKMSDRVDVFFEGVDRSYSPNRQQYSALERLEHQVEAKLRREAGFSSSGKDPHES